VESISGLPAHTLFVHAPVVLMPLALLLTIWLAAKPNHRRRFGLLLAGAALVVLVATFLAVSSGQAFDEIVGDRVDTGDHERLATVTLVLVAAFAVSALAMALVDRRSARATPPEDDPSSTLTTAGWALTALTVATAALATLWMVRTGEEGARLVWHGVVGVVRLVG
jgi:preprotein translocase subunit SecG